MSSSLASIANLNVDLIPAGKQNRPGDNITVSYITIHNTDNPNSGADAKAHSKFVKNTGYYTLSNGTKNWVSWHFTVDDKEIYQHLPLNERGYHAGSGNSQSIGIEICMNSDGDLSAANARAAILVSALLKDFGFDSSRLRGHIDWTGKKCPSRLLDSGAKGAKWDAFVASVDAAGSFLATASIASGLGKGVKTSTKPSAFAATAAMASSAEPDCKHEKIPERFLTRSTKRTTKRKPRT
jgi:N-acetylmuramoyl-L-alanine amidase